MKPSRPLLALALACLLALPAMAPVAAKNHAPAVTPSAPGTASAPSSFAAIAYSETTLAVGMAQDMPSQAVAEAAALAACATQASDCQVRMWSGDGCAALAIANEANGGWGAAWGVSFGEAALNAQNTCQEYNAACQVYAWTCNAVAAPRR